MKVVQLFLGKHIAVKLIAIQMVQSAILNVIEMKKFIKSSLVILLGSWVFNASAQDLQFCKAQANELKQYHRAQLLSYVCESKKSVRFAESKLHEMQINFSKNSGRFSNVSSLDFSTMKNIADNKENCIESLVKAFEELKKYGINGGSIDDDIDYCSK